MMMTSYKRTYIFLYLQNKSNIYSNKITKYVVIIKQSLAILHLFKLKHTFSLSAVFNCKFYIAPIIS